MLQTNKLDSTLLRWKLCDGACQDNGKIADSHAWTKLFGTPYDFRRLRSLHSMACRSARNLYNHGVH